MKMIIMELMKYNKINNLVCKKYKSEMKNDSNLDLISFPKEKFEYLVRKIKLCEGYSKESIDELIDEILDINGFNKKEVNEDELESTVKK